jgi:hypothetical protein
VIGAPQSAAMHAAARNLDSCMQSHHRYSIRRLRRQPNCLPPHAEWDEISGAWIEDDALQAWR